MLHNYEVRIKTNNGEIKWSVVANTEEEAKIKAIKEVIEQMEIAGYKVQEVKEVED